MEHLREQWRKTSGQTERAYRGVPLVVDADRGVPILEALVAGRTNVAARLLIDAMAFGTKQRWWAGSNEPDDEAGRWWTTDARSAREYAQGSFDGWMTIPVLMTATVPDAGGEMDAQGRSWWHLDPGTPLTVTEFSAIFPDDPQALLDGWRGISSPGNFDHPQSYWDGEWSALPIPPMRTTASLSLESVISVAEQAMERTGNAGKTVAVPVGHYDDPAFQAQLAPLVAWVRGLTGTNVRFYASDYQLDQEGGAQAMTDGYDKIVVRPVTNEMTVLHEVAHVKLRTAEGSRGHTPEFARLLRDLYAAHIGPEAAAVFWDIVGPYVDGRTAKTAVAYPLFRGIHLQGNLSPDDAIALLRSRGLGQHWSTERWVAEYWAKGSSGTRVIIEAKRPLSGFETDPDVLRSLETQGGDGWEQETTLRKGTEIEVVKFRFSGESRPGGRFTV